MPENGDSNPMLATIELMETQIAKWQAALDSLREIYASMGGQLSVSPGSRNGRDVSFGHDAFFGLTAADASRKYLEATKKTATVKTIADALIAGGWKTAAKNVNENLRTILSRTPAFVTINGEFGLSEWYPGRKSGGRAKRSNSSETDSSEEESYDSSEESSSSES